MILLVKHVDRTCMLPISIRMMTNFKHLVTLLLSTRLCPRYLPMSLSYKHLPFVTQLILGQFPVGGETTKGLGLSSEKTLCIQDFPHFNTPNFTDR